MNSSGIKRGLATAAITALAVTGIPALASAQTVAQGETAFELYSQYSGGASTRNDGNNTTVTLLAGVPTGAGAVQVRFSYMKGGTPVVIQNVVPINGVATMEWTPPTGVEGAAITAVRAEMLDAANNVIGAPDDNAIAGATIPTNQAAHLNGALRSNVGMGPDDEVVVTGNVTTAGVTVTNLGPTAAGAPAAGTVGIPDANNVRAFSAVVPVAAANVVNAQNNGTGTDELVIGAASDAPASDDVNVYTMYQQVVASATVTPNAATVQAGGVDNDSSYVFTVTDQSGAPVQGQDIYESNAAGAATDGNGRDATGAPSAAGETGTDGKMTVKLRESDIDNGTDQDPTVGTQATHYVVDVNQNGVYDNGIDFKYRISQTKVTAVPTTVEISSAKGQAMDDDESSVITITVKDQTGTPIQGVTPVVKLTEDNLERQNNTPAQPGADYTDPQVSNPTPGATDADGKTTFTLSPQDSYRIDNKIEVYVNNNGTPQPDAGDAIATPLTVVSDTSSIIWASGDNDQAQNGTTTTQSAKLAQDGLPAGARGTSAGLAGRTVTVNYNPTDNSVLAPQAQQPAGTTRLSDTTATVITGAGGAFGVAVTDPAVPNGQELNNDLTADAPGLNAGNRFDDFTGDGVEDGFEISGDSTDDTLEIDFLRSVTPASVVIFNDDGGSTDTADGLDGDFANQQPNGGLLPDSMAEGGVQAKNADGIILTNVDVTLTIDEGHFSDRENPYKATPAPGAIFEMNDIGKTITVNTEDGIGEFYANIERNTGFDDDGIVQDGLTATVGAVSDDHDFTWTTVGTPITQRQTDGLIVSESADQESTILPKARAGDPDGSGQEVYYDVKTFDHYDNPTSQDIAVTDNTPVANFSVLGQDLNDDGDTNDAGESSWSQLALGQPAIVATSPAAANQAIEVEINNSQKRVYKDNVNDSSFDPNNPNDQTEVLFTDLQQTTDAINWYEFDFAASTFTFGQEGPENVPVGTTVTMVLDATDQEGQAIEGLFVDFFRAGPGDEDSDGNNGDRTSDDGEAFYDFTGASPGVATITAVAYDDNGDRLGRVGTDTVNFGGTTPPPPVDTGRIEINAVLTGLDNGAANDRLKVTTKRKLAAGATVRLFKKVRGVKVLVKTKKLNEFGAARFIAIDRNGRDRTDYFAIVSRTAETKADRTNNKTIR